MPPKPSKVLKPAWASTKKRMTKKNQTSGEDVYQGQRVDETPSAPLSQVALNTRSATEMEVDTDSPRLRITLDIGTTRTKAAWTVWDPNDKDSPLVIFHVQWSREVYETPTVFTYRNSKLYWGPQVEKWLENHQISESEVMRQAKLALHKDSKVENISSNVKALLAKEGKTIYDLFADYVSGLIVVIKQRIFSSTAANKAYDENMPIDMMISTPQVWQPKDNIVLIEAAKKVGVSDCRIVGEALCVAACVLAHDIDKKETPEDRRLLKRGDMVLVLDLGGGTGDFVLMELVDPILASPRLGMRVVHASGSLCGSVWINKNFTKWLETEHFPNEKEGLEMTANLLGFSTPQEFLSRADAALDEAKKKFPNGDRYAVTVFGKTNFKPAWNVVFSKTQMATFFEPVLADIDAQTAIVLAHPEVETKLKCLILSGGLGKSQYVIDHLTEKWKGRVSVKYPAIDHKGPIPEGALRRYDVSAVEPLGSDWSFCVARAEDYNPHHHPDAVVDESLVESDPVDSSIDVVSDRCFFIKNAVTNTTQECWTQHYPEANKKKPVDFVAEVFWTTSQDIADHEALYEPHSKTLKPKFMAFASVCRSIPDHDKLGWTVIEADNGENVYELWACVVMRCSGSKIRCGFKVISDGTQPFDVHGNPVSNQQAHAQIYWDETSDFSEIWNQRFNHVARETDPLAVMLPIKNTAAIKKTKKKGLPLLVRGTTEMESEHDDIPY